LLRRATVVSDPEKMIKLNAAAARIMARKNTT
jgi:hypothetical protein